MLLGGESAWHGFLELATTPVFLGLDVLLLFGLLFHGLNGLRVALVGTGIAADRQKALFWSLMIIRRDPLAGRDAAHRGERLMAVTRADRARR